MKKSNLLIAIVIILAGNVTLASFSQENIRTLIKNNENTGVVKTDIVRKNYPMIKKFGIVKLV